MTTSNLAIPLNLPADVPTAPPLHSGVTATVAAKPAVGRLLLQNINKRFTNSDVSALSDISLDCQPGEFVVVVGPSGCGKTTLLNIAAGMTRPADGVAT